MQNESHQTDMSGKIRSDCILLLISHELRRGDGSEPAGKTRWSSLLCAHRLLFLLEVGEDISKTSVLCPGFVP